MKKWLIIMLAVLSGNMLIAQDQYAGYWKGAVTRDGAVQPIEVYFRLQGDSISGTYHLPDMGMYDEALTIISTNDTSLSLRAIGFMFCWLKPNVSSINIPGAITTRPSGIIHFAPVNPNLERLVRYCSVSVYGLAEIFIPDQQKQKNLFSKLQDAYVDTRYKDYSISTDELLQLETKIRRFIEVFKAQKYITHP